MRVLSQSHYFLLYPLHPCFHFLLSLSHWPLSFQTELIHYYALRLAACCEIRAGVLRHYWLKAKKRWFFSQRRSEWMHGWEGCLSCTSRHEIRSWTRAWIVACSLGAVHSSLLARLLSATACTLTAFLERAARLLLSERSRRGRS